MAGWLSGSSMVFINIVNLHWTQLVLGWATIREMESRSHNIGISPTMLTQPGLSKWLDYQLVGEQAHYAMH